MKFFKLSILLCFLSANLFSQCLQNACENLPATITANVTAPPIGETYSYNWTLGLAFTGQGTSVISVTNVGAAVANYPYSIEVTNNTTGCVSIYNCILNVDASAPISFTPPPYCVGSAPFDLVAYAPVGTIFSGSAVTGTMYDPAIGGPVTATPPVGSPGCLASNTQTPAINSGPVILSTTVTQ